MVYQKIDDQWLPIQLFPLFKVRRAPTRKDGVMKSYNKASSYSSSCPHHRFQQNPLKKDYHEQNPNTTHNKPTSCHIKKVTWAPNSSLVKQTRVIPGNKFGHSSSSNRGKNSWITKRSRNNGKSKNPPQEPKSVKPHSDFNSEPNNQKPFHCPNNFHYHYPTLISKLVGCLPNGSG